MKGLALICLLFASAMAQKKGGYTPDFEPEFDIQVCTSGGSCTQETAEVALDSNWRWIHKVDDYTNCYTGNTWDNALCPDADTCTNNCALEGVSEGEWTGTYGIDVSPDRASFTFVTNGPYGANIGARTYLLDSSRTKYRMFKLLNKEFTFDVDVSELPCGLNGALYFVEMEDDGGSSKYPTNECGATLGTGYCDAQCPHDMKWIYGEANCDDWQPSDNDANSGKGHYGTCCAEMDLWEANTQAQAFTSHPCSKDGYYRCEGTECGDDNDRYNGVCDKDGCDFASYRMGDKTYYGEGSNFKVDTTQPFTVVTQFLTSDGTDNGDLVEIRRKYVQNGQVIENSKVNFPGTTAYDSITDEMCEEVKQLYGDTNDHAKKGGLKQMGEAMRRGMVFVMSMWDDHEARMLWLDSIYPVGGDPSKPGVERGPCPPSSGEPGDVEANFPNSHVIFSNVKFGDIDSTY